MKKFLFIVAAAILVIDVVAACGSLPVSLGGPAEDVVDAGAVEDAGATEDTGIVEDAGAVDISDAGLCKPGHGYGDKNHCHVHKHP